MQKMQDEAGENLVIFPKMSVYEACPVPSTVYSELLNFGTSHIRVILKTCDLFSDGSKDRAQWYGIVQRKRCDDNTEQRTRG